MSWKISEYKDIVCRGCATFLNSEELVEGNCPLCETDESLYSNNEEE